MDKSVKIEQTGLDVCITTTTYHYDAFGRRIAKRSTTQNQSKLTPKHEILPYQNTVQYDKNKQQTTLMLWDGNRPIQEYSDSHVFTTVYEQNSFAPVARLVWLKQALIDKKVSDKDKQWLTKFNQWALEQRINPRGKFQHDDDYAKKDKLDDIISIKVFYYHNDQLGTPNELTTNEGEVIWIADYKAWGNTAKVVWHEEKIEQLQIAKEHLQPIRFQGQFYDSETGLHYNRFRYYDNDVGMFISRDPIGLLGGENVFAYAPNPTGFIDPFGLAKVDFDTLWDNYDDDGQGIIKKAGGKVTQFQGENTCAIRLSNTFNKSKQNVPHPSKLPNNIRVSTSDHSGNFIYGSQDMNRYLHSIYGEPTHSYIMTGDNAEELYDKISDTQGIISFKFGSGTMGGSSGHVDLVKPVWFGQGYEMAGNGYLVDDYLERGATPEHHGKVEVWKIE